MTATTERTPSYEELEMKMNNLDNLSYACSHSMDMCVDAYISGREFNAGVNEASPQVENVAIIHKLNNYADMIRDNLMSIQESCDVLKAEIPRRIYGGV